MNHSKAAKTFLHKKHSHYTMSQENNEQDSKESNAKHPWDALDVDFIVSVDFGSSGFAAAFCHVDIPDDQRIIPYDNCISRAVKVKPWMKKQIHFRTRRRRNTPFVR